jgi:hypothetical protein
VFIDPPEVLELFPTLTFEGVADGIALLDRVDVPLSAAGEFTFLVDSDPTLDLELE